MVSNSVCARVQWRHDVYDTRTMHVGRMYRHVTRHEGGHVLWVPRGFGLGLHAKSAHAIVPGHEAAVGAAPGNGLAHKILCGVILQSRVAGAAVRKNKARPRPQDIAHALVVLVQSQTVPILECQHLIGTIIIRRRVWGTVLHLRTHTPNL